MDSNEENRLRDLRGRLKNTNNTPAVVVVSEDAGGNPAESKGEWFPRELVYNYTRPLLVLSTWNL